MSGTGKHASVLRRSPTQQQQQQNGSYSGGKVTKTPQSRGTKSKIVLAPMNGELGKAEETRSTGMRGRSSSFGKEEMNLMAVRKVDPNVAEILSTVSQVMLYQYDQASGEWERTSVEGTLFIYMYNRSGVSPRYGFMILNRLSNDNMLEEIAPNTEFRVQNPFVLFKKSTGNIFGLCFQEESNCQETGQLLNSLGTQENHLPVVGHSSPRSRKNPNLNASMRSTSAPAFKQTATSAAVNGKPYLVDVLENGSYTSSEGENTSSPDSLTSDPISFVAAAAPPASSAHPAGAILSRSHHGKHKSRDKAASPVSQKQHTKSSTPGKNSMQSSSSSSSSSSRNIPSSKGGSGAGGSGQGQRSQQFSSGSASPSKGRSRSPKQQRQQQQNGGTGSGSGSGRARGEMRHAASFDHGFTSGTSPLRSFTAPTTHHHHHPQQQHQGHDFFSPQQLPHHQNQQVVLVQPSSAFERLAAEVSVQQQQQPVVDKTVRRLFTADTSYDVVTSQPLHSGESVPTSLQSIFSQVSTSTADSTTADSTNPPHGATTGGGSGDVLPLKVISLEQVEKQIVADVPSPVSINPLTLFSGGSNGSGVSSIAPSLPISTSSAKPSEASQQYRILLQPSAFMPSTVSVTTSVGNPNTSVSSVAISIEPPTPMVAPGPIFANGGGGSGSGTPSSNLKAQLLPESATPPSAVSSSMVFPSIPPLMHSPGMRAAPVSRVNHHPKQPTQPQPQQQTRGEPSSLVTTIATSSAPRVAQPTVTAVSQVGVGKPSQQISSTTEERRPPQATPQRYSSQSTPSLTPLAELSIPRRSTTAPTANIVPGGPAGALMSPHQFTHSTSTAAVVEKSSGGQGEEGSKVTTTKGPEPVGLSREQLQQAMLYLIKHDDGFLSKLHEAYHLSLSEKQV